MIFIKIPMITLLALLLALLSTNAKSDPLERRNPYAIQNFVESERFVVYWGEGVIVSDAQDLLDILEFSWVRAIEEMGFEQPTTMQSYKLNVYVSGTGQVPYDDEQGGFAILDNQFHEAFILHKRALGRSDLYLGATHEFFHTIQSSYGLIRSDAMRGVGWLGEAMANWFVPMTWNDSEATAINALAQYAFYPQYSLDHVSPSDPKINDYLLSGHQYGTYLLFDHLSEKTADPDFVVKFLRYLKPLVQQTKDKDALQELAFFTEQNYGITLRELFASFVARNSEWDYSDRSIYLSALDRQRQSFPDQKIAATQTIIDNQWHDAPQNTLPHQWAANYVKFLPNGANIVEIGFEGNGEGDYGNPSDWQITAVISSGGTFEYITLPLENGKINSFEISVENADTLWLAISITSDVKNQIEQFAYRYQIALPGESQPSPNSSVTYESEIEVETTTLSSGGGPLNVFCLLIMFFLIRNNRTNTSCALTVSVNDKLN
jgi:hypothetical protein